MVVILGILAVLAIPQLSRAAAPDAGAVLARNLKVLRLASERYRQDHGVFPAQTGDGVHAAGSEAAFVAQLTRYTDAQGRASDTQDSVHCFGPYLRDGIPPSPIPPHEGSSGVHMLTGSAPLTFEPEAVAGWVYNCDTGGIAPNTDAADATGRSYASY